ncbi:MAG: esterase family protein [Oscillospiraceae bacterium]|nr:esterase family protein [Oscillospiraceae bacterium]
MTTKTSRMAAAVMALIMLMLVMPAAIAEEAPLTITVTVPDTFEGKLNGRVLFMLDYETPGEGDQLFDYLDVTGIPVFGKTVFGLKAGDVITLSADDPDVYGYPMQLSEVPEGEYAAQAFFIRYTRFDRKNLPPIWAMAEHGGGGSFTSNPYNLYSDVAEVSIGADAVSLELTYETPLGYELAEGQVDQQGNYEDTDLVKFIKIKSGLLTDFWGMDMYLGANVLLPKDYDPAKKYPVLYYQGHFPGGSAPLSYGRTGRESYDEFNAYWDNDAPEMIVVTFRDATPFYDTSYSVDTASMGPYGEAITTELIPYIEKTFGGVAEPWARALSGGSTGGWEALAMQVFYPDMFGGTWPLCPDGVDFHGYQIVNLYDDDNAYYLDGGWVKTERPSARDTLGNIRWTIKQENNYERAIGGDTDTSLGQWAIWEAVYSPLREDGYPAHVWDPITGEIDDEVVAYWSEHYDLTRILQDNWDELGPQLEGKLHLRGGDMDNYYLNIAQYILGDWLETTVDPYYGGYSKTFPRTGHSGSITNQDLLEEIATHMIKYGPQDAAEILGR